MSSPGFGGKEMVAVTDIEQSLKAYIMGQERRPRIPDCGGGTWVAGVTCTEQELGV